MTSLLPDKEPAEARTASGVTTIALTPTAGRSVAPEEAFADAPGDHRAAGEPTPAAPAAAWTPGAGGASAQSVRPADAKDAPSERVHNPLRMLLAHQLREQATGLWLAACFLPVVLMLAATNNWIVSRGDDDPDYDVRQPEGPFPNDDVQLVRSALYVFVGMGTGGAGFTQALLMLHNLGCRATRQVYVGCALVFLVPGLVGAGREWIFEDADDVYTGVLLLSMLVSCGWLAWATGRAAQQPALGRLLFVSYMGSSLVIIMILRVAGGVVLDPATTDTARLLFLVVVQPVLLDVALLPLRLMARRFPGRDPSYALGQLLYALTLSNLLERWLLTAMASATAAVVGVVLVAFKDVAFRRSTVLRDRLVLRLTRRSAAAAEPKSDAELRVNAIVRNMDEISDSMATWTSLAVNLAMRISDSRAAPAATPQVLSCLLQVALEAASDVGPGYFMLHSTDARAARIKRSIAARVRELRRWRRGHLAVAFIMMFGAALFFVQALADPDSADEAMLCAWSEQGGWWHRVSCRRAEEWIAAGAE